MRNGLCCVLLSIIIAICSFDAKCATAMANALIVNGLTVTATNQLEFGSLAASSTAGTISQNGTTTGGVNAVSSGATRSAAIFTVSGESSSNANYTFTLPPSITLVSGANQMTATLSVASGSGAGNAGSINRTLASGTDILTINGILSVAANQASGSYIGTYNVEATY